MINFIHELNTDKKIFNEGCLYEGTHYDKEAAKILAEVCDIETAQKIIDSLIKEDWVSIFTHTDWIYKFLKPVARIYVEEVKKNKSLADVIQDTIDLLGQFLMYVKANKESKDKLYSFFDKAHIGDVQKFMDDYQNELEKAEASQPKPEYGSNEYDVIKIDSYEQVHSMFGGMWTGDGKSDKGADNTYGTGNTAWCHANLTKSYDTHTKHGRLLFFVAAKKNWKEIPPEKTEGNPLDEYGLSLIAIIATKSGRLLETTLRWNHVGVDNADHVFKTWNQLNDACGQDIQKECEKYFDASTTENDSPFIVQDGVLQRNPVFGDDPLDTLDQKEFSIPEGTRVIGEAVFARWHNLRKVIIPNGVKEIGEKAFYRCKGLTSITIPDSMTKIGDKAFFICSNLVDMKIPDGVTSIGSYTFYGCENLTNVSIPNSVTKIDIYAFFGCTKLTTFSIPNSVTNIGKDAFYGCSSLTEVKIPDDVTSIGDNAFYGCNNLKIIKCNNPRIVELIKSQIG